ncbi:transcriptional regulator [Burkholderia sp. MSMB617WGS]|uniref:LysR family transcriptional regulator n=1 Tax=Burkholderia sp. MSMB617WGS TaxID=1637831 RepID=UPI00075FC198|nr:LysR family transcriptional regulator [Burkholderia sp. MSMB617WGS]AOK47654.1 transcriptional regulator [Burkholderia sp. MSMB617WGS]
MGNTSTEWRGADLALLAALDVLLEEANVTRAAARLHLSQPALSAQLARLRELIGDPLLLPAKNGRGMVPTARALALRGPLRGALRELRTALRHGAAFDPSTDERTFQIVASDNGFVMAGLDLVRRVATRAPGVRLAFRNLPADAAGAMLERGEADLLIAADFSVPRTTVARLLLQERYVMAQRKGHPRGLAPPDLDAYCALRHVIVSGDGGGFHGFMDDRLRALGRSRAVAVSVQQYHLAPLVLEATDYVCALPERFLMRFAKRLDLLPLPVEVEGFKLAAAWHPRLQADPAHRWLRDELCAVVRQRTGEPEPEPEPAPESGGGARTTKP